MRRNRWRIVLLMALSACIGCEQDQARTSTRLRRAVSPAARPPQQQPAQQPRPKVAAFAGRCLRLVDGTLRCPVAAGTRAIASTELDGATSVSCGRSGESCANYASGVVKCWGTSYVRKLQPNHCSWETGTDLGEYTDAEADCPKQGDDWYCPWKTPTCPTAATVANLADIAALEGSCDTGSERACAVSQVGALYCWGSNAEQQTASRARCLIGEPPVDYMRGGSDYDCRNPTRVKVPAVKDLAFAAYRTCAATRAGEVYCWGRLPDGYDVSGKREFTQAPTKQRRWQSIAEVAFNGEVLYGLTRTGQVIRQQVGEAPRVFRGLGTVAALAVSDPLACALEASGEVKCWTEEWTCRPSPDDCLERLGLDGIHAVPSLGSVLALGAPLCALKSDGEVWCWTLTAQGLQAPEPIAY